VIAPVEAALAVIGLRTIISKEVEKVTRAKLDKMAGLEKEIGKLARQMVNNELTETFYSDLNYRAMLRELSNGVDLKQVQEMVDQFPTEFRDVGNAVTIAASQIIQQLSDMLPRSFYTTVAGPTSLLPDDMKLWKFVSILEVLDNPLMVFPLMNTGALLRSQAMAVRQMYPTLSEVIDQAILGATVKAKAARKSFELAPRAEVGVQNWIRTNTAPDAAPAVEKLAATQKKRLQSSQAAAKQGKEKQEKRESAKAAKTVAMTETTSERSNMNAP
jgi:hypothetical protein